MADTQVTAPTAQDIEKMITDRIAAVEAERNKANPPANPPNLEQTATKPITVSIRGQQYTFNDEAALAQAMETSFNQYDSKITELQQTSDGKGKHVSDDKADEPQWDFQTYINKMGVDPRDAQAYMDQIRFGFDPVEELRKMREIVEKQSTSLEEERRSRLATEFRAMHPDFPAGPEAAQVLGKTMQMLGMDFSAQALEASYAVALQRGWLKKEESEETIPMSPNNPWPQGIPSMAPPRISRSNQEAGPDILAQAENLSADDLGKLLSSIKY